MTFIQRAFVKTTFVQRAYVKTTFFWLNKYLKNKSNKNVFSKNVNRTFFSVPTIHQDNRELVIGLKNRKEKQLLTKKKY